jgi:hypothetical protein
LICSGLNAFCGGAGAAARLAAHNTAARNVVFMSSPPSKRRNNNASGSLRQGKFPAFISFRLAIARQSQLVESCSPGRNLTQFVNGRQNLTQNRGI